MNVLMIDIGDDRIYPLSIRIDAITAVEKTEKEALVKLKSMLNGYRDVIDKYVETVNERIDERVNKTTPALFERCKTVEDFANIDIKELEDFIHPCGFFKNKAKNIKLCANQILEKFNGQVPNNMKDLMSLAGVGRKTSNVVLLEVFGIAEGIAVDTHAKRISNLIGLSNEKEPEKIEQDLIKIFPKEYLKDINHLFVWHGRNTCIARNPKCDVCTIKDYCKHYKKVHNKK